MTEITTLGFGTNYAAKELGQKPVTTEVAPASVFSKLQETKKAVYEASEGKVEEKIKEFIDVKKGIFEPAQAEVKETKTAPNNALRRENEKIENILAGGETTKKNLSPTDNIKIVNRHTKEQIKGEVTSVERGKFDHIKSLTVTSEKGNSFTYTYDKSTNRYKDSTGKKFYLMKPDGTLVRDNTLNPKITAKPVAKTAPKAPAAEVKVSTEAAPTAPDKNTITFEKFNAKEYKKFQDTFNEFFGKSKYTLRSAVN